MHTFARQWRHVITISLIPLMAAACGSDLPADSRCRNLEYKDYGLSRAEYMPCAGEIVAALDELGRQSEAASRGDQGARSEGRAALSRVNALMAAAGGRNLLERWQDRGLTNLNLAISNAVTSYQAFYMVRVLEEPNQFAEQSRQAAASELSKAMRNHDEARGYYRRLQ